MPAEWGDKIMHARMTVGNQMLMASDAPPGRYNKPAGFSVNIGLNEPAEAERVFQRAGGKRTSPHADSRNFWAVRFGMLVDQFGIPWMVNVEKPM